MRVPLTRALLGLTFLRFVIWREIGIDPVVLGRIGALFRVVFSFWDQSFIHVAVRLLPDRAVAFDTDVAFVLILSATVCALDGIGRLR